MSLALYNVINYSSSLRHELRFLEHTRYRSKTNGFQISTIFMVPTGSTYNFAKRHILFTHEVVPLPRPISSRRNPHAKGYFTSFVTGGRSRRFESLLAISTKSTILTLSLPLPPDPPSVIVAAVIALAVATSPFIRTGKWFFCCPIALRKTTAKSISTYTTPRPSLSPEFLPNAECFVPLSLW